MSLFIGYGVVLHLYNICYYKYETWLASGLCTCLAPSDVTCVWHQNCSTGIGGIATENLLAPNRPKKSHWNDRFAGWSAIAEHEAWAVILQSTLPASRVSAAPRNNAVNTLTGARRNTKGKYSNQQRKMMASHFTTTKQGTTLISRVQPFWQRKNHIGGDWLLRESKSKNSIQQAGQTYNLVTKSIHAEIRFFIQKNPEHQDLNLRVRFEIQM